MSQVPGSQDPGPGDSQDVMNMFDCVWVKVEELDNDESDEMSDVLPSADENPTVMPKSNSEQKNTKLLQCDQCDYTTVHNAYLRIHIFNHSNTELSCQYCDYKSKYPMSVKRHMSIKHCDPKNKTEKPKGRFSCDLCDYTSSYKWNLNSHKRKHKLEKQFKCKECSYESSYRHNYLKHCKTHEEVMGKSTLKCDKCPFETKYKGHIQRHMAKIHNEVIGQARYICDLCGFSTNEKWRLKLHQQRSKCNKIIKCAFCEFESYYKCCFRKHRQIHFNDIERNGKLNNSIHLDQKTMTEKETKKSVENYENSVEMAGESVENVDEGDAFLRCKHCIFETIYQGVMDRHLSQVHNEIIEHEHTCQKCLFSTKEKFRLTLHLDNSKSDKLLQCNLCDLQTFFKCEIRKHKQTHFIEICGNVDNIDCSNIKDQIDTMLKESAIENPSEKSTDFVENGEKSVESVCSDDKDVQNINASTKKRFSDYVLDPDCVEWSTIQVLETPDKERPFQCNFCQYSSKFKASVQRHFQRQHAGNKNRPYKCCNCDFSTKTKEQISLHNKRSQSNTQLTCNSCNYCTYFKCALIYHQKEHYLFKCKACSYSCRQKYDLTKHYANYHLGNCLKCQYCDFTAVRKESILCHETIHTGIKPYNCNLCDYSSVRKTLLEIHFRRHHSDTTNRVGVSETQIESLAPTEEQENDVHVQSIET